MDSNSTKEKLQSSASVADGADLKPCYMQKFRLYETRSKFYMIGRDKNRTVWRILKIDRLEPSELNIVEDSTIYSEIECCDLLRRIHEGNKSTGGLKFVTTCYGIIGFIKFLEPYYMLLITKRRKIGTICGHNIYAVTKSEMVPIPHSTVRSKMAYSKDENRYKKLLCSVDLAKDFFFSYSYNVMFSLQRNLSDHNTTGQSLYETLFVWNEFLTRGIRNNLQNTSWTVALVYGFFKQVKLSISDSEFNLTIIARRSRHYAGTRYLKRGVNEKGRVANDVETEQIVFTEARDGHPMQISSVVQIRGSIPLFWSQEASRLNIKPDIILSRKDSNFEATRLHFDNLVKRYGNPIIILNLIKTREKKPRETILRTEFANAVRSINKNLRGEDRLRFLHWDLHRHSRCSKATNVLGQLGKVAAYALKLTGIFYSPVTPNMRLDRLSQYSYSENNNVIDHCITEEASINKNNVDKETEISNCYCRNDENKDYSVKPQTLQSGVLRTNCIDCLDRTNVAQYAYGLAALGGQLQVLGFIESPHIDLDNPLAEELMEVYESMGDTLAFQYGGSAAHNKIFSERRGQWKAATQSQEFIPPVSSSERVDLARLCASKDWSKAIRILDSLISHSTAVQDLCNRAFCYSKLELHKHVIKDCDRALQLDPTLLQAYILKGSALSVLGRKENALLVWEQGYELALHQSADLKQLLELEELIATAKQGNNALCEGETHRPSILQTISGSPINGNLSETFKFQDTLGTKAELCDNATSDKSEICLKAADSFNLKSETHDEDRESNKSDGQVNGSPDVLDTLSYNSESCNDSSDASESSEKVSTNSGDSVNVTEIFRNPISKFIFSDERKGEAKKNKKFCVARISNTNSISVDFRLSRGIAEVNEGKYVNAISIFDQILKKDPAYPEALIGRGTAYAFQRELDAAIVDFTKAIQFNPLAGEAWKRRGQARAALGEFVEAIEDLTKALEFEPDTADILHERGIVNFKFKEFDAAVEDLSACVKLDKDNTSAYTYLGLALSSIGEYKKAEEAHLKSLQLDKNFLEAWAHLTQFYQDLAMPTKALECLNNMLQIDGRFARAYHLRGLLFHAMGEHRKAIKDLTMGLSIDGSNIECLYLRASCYHAVGQFKEAVKDYDAALDLELDSMDKFVLQCLAFYQKEIALYTASKFNGDFCWFDIDGDIDALFKEYWCKKLHPKNVCEKVFRQPPLRESLRKGKLKKQEFTITKQKAALLLASDSIGMKIQYDCPGFLPNRRQHRMAGLATIEIAQKVSKAWRSLRAEVKCSNKGNSKNGKRARRRERFNMTSQNRGGAGCSTSSSSVTPSNGIIDERSSSRILSWHDVYSLAVRWRQISEPCDPVVWVNKLSDEFIAGFGSHTPMILGQAKVVRYFPNYERTLEIAKAVMKEKTFVRSKTDKIIHLSEDGKLEEIMHAKSCSDLYRVVGEDFWLATWCNSTAFEGKQLEGTRITVVKMGEHGFDFAIRTPSTPARWEDFDEEMTVAWETICNAYCGENYGSTDFDMLENVRDAILRMTYYWYNFMPLSRGSAAVGFIVMLGLLLAANMEFTGSIPQDLQVDWEAILNLDPNSFVDSVKTWLYPSLKVTTSWKDYHDVASTFATTGSVIAALNFSSDD